MSLFAMYERHLPSNTPITREIAQHELSGNLCRCTGYRPIFDAAQSMVSYPKSLVDRKALLDQIKKGRAQFSEPTPLVSEPTHPDSFYIQPKAIKDAIALKQKHPNALLVAGGTDVGLWVTKQHLKASQIIDVSNIKECLEISKSNQGLVIGASVPLSKAFGVLDDYLADQGLAGNTEFFQRYAGLLIRESATLGGNLANGSPIGDSMPLLIALNAQINVASDKGLRSCPMETFYTGYRKSILSADEIIQSILIPPQALSLLRALKLSKRRDDDISAVCLVVGLNIEANIITAARIGVGGVAETPKRAIQTEARLVGKPWTEPTINEAAEILANEFKPISDMRASALYRKKALAGLLKRVYFE